MTRRILFATSSRGKLGEGRRLLAPAAVSFVGLDDLGCRAAVAEDAPDYEGNARIKARYWAERAGMAALGDDSGLEVAALGGGPGVLSARFAGPGLDDAGRNRALLAALAPVPLAGRDARFVCCLVLWEPASGETACVRGVCPGRIALTPRGERGFGYDPLFELPELGRTFAELSEDEKDRLSHRGRAFTVLRALLGGEEALRS